MSTKGSFSTVCKWPLLYYFGFLYVFLLLPLPVSAQFSLTDSRADSMYNSFLNEDLSVVQRRKNLKLLIWENYLFSQPDSAAYYTHILYDFCITNGDNDGASIALNTLAISHAIRNDYGTAKEIFEQNIEPSIKENNWLLVAQTYNNIGNCDLEQKHYYGALDYFNKGLVVYQSILDTCRTDARTDILKNIVITYTNILIVYIDLNELDKAHDLKKELEKMLPDFESVPDHTLLCYNIALLEFKSENYREAIDVIDTNIFNQHERPENLSMALAQSLMGEIYLKQYQLDSASVYLNKGLTLFDTIGNVKGVAKNKIDLGIIALELEQDEKAFRLFKEAMTISRDKDLAEELSRSYKMLSDYYSKINKPSKAYQYFLSYHQLEDSIQYEQEQNLLLSLEDKYEYETELAQKKTSLQLENEKLDSAKRFLYGAILAAFLMLLLTYFLFRLNRKLKQQQHTLTIKNQEFEDANTSLEEKNKLLDVLNARLNEKTAIISDQNTKLKVLIGKLEESNTNLSEFAAVAAHDLKAPLRTISSFSKLLYEKHCDALDAQDKMMFDFILKDCSSLNRLIVGLLNYSSISNELSQETSIHLEDILDSVRMNLSAVITETATVLNIPKDLPIICGHASIIEQVFLNFFTNAIKFRKECTTPIITLSTEKYDDQYIKITIVDNGIGIDSKHHENIFDVFTKLHPAHVYEGTGLGLSTCKKIVEGYGGKIWLDSVLGEGTSFYFTLKVRDSS